MRNSKSSGSGVIANQNLLGSSIWGQAVYKLRVVRGQPVALYAASRPASQGLGTSTYFCTQEDRIPSPTFSTAFSLFSHLLTGHFSPLSTGPIKTTTKYISNIGVIAS
jgi:hypothetical protein